MAQEMTKEQQERAKTLLQATSDILNKCDKGIYVKNVLEMTAVWDEAECDGLCLKEEIEFLIEEINNNKENN